MSVFSDKLSELMKAFDMSDEQLANLTGVNRTTVTRWRTGERSPKMEKLPEISAVFNVKPQIFVGEIGNDKNDILPIYNQLDPSRQKVVYETAEQQLEEQLEEQNNVVNLKEVEKDSVVKHGVDTMAARFTDPEKGLPEGVTIEELKAYLESEAKRHGFENRPE